MAVIRLQGDKKEIYIKNLLSATGFLIKIIRDDDTLKKSDWDRIVYEEVTKMLSTVKELFYFLQKTTNDKDYKNNFGIYSDVVLSNGGLPEFFSYRQLLDDKIKADEKINSIYENEGISSKEELAKKWVDIANTSWENKEYRRHSLLNIIPDKYQEIEFYEKLKAAPLFDTARSMDKLSVKFIGNDKEKRYIISWFNYVLGNGVWNIYVAKMLEIERKSFLNRKDNIMYYDADNKTWNRIDDTFKKFLEDHISSGAFFLARDIDKFFPTIYPERITMFQFGPNFVEGIKLGEYSQLIKNGEYFLTAQREDIENSGKNLSRTNSGKYIWRADKLIEEKFGICSKELEKPLKENIKIANMRFYVL